MESLGGRSAETRDCREAGRPVVHQPPPALEQVSRRPPPDCAGPRALAPPRSPTCSVLRDAVFAFSTPQTGAVRGVFAIDHLRGRRQEPEGLGNSGLAGARHLGEWRQVEAALARGTDHGREYLPGIHALAGAGAAAHLADGRGPEACSACQLVASINGSRRKRNTAGNSLAGCFAKRLASFNGGGASISRAGRASSRPAPDGSRPPAAGVGGVPGVLLSSGRLRAAASVALATHAPRIGTCAPKLHTTSRILSLLPEKRRRHRISRKNL